MVGEHPADPAESFGGWVRARRTELLMTQEQLAEASGLSVRTVRNLEAGRGAAPRLETQRLVIAALGGPRAATRLPAPAQLPLDIAGFIGRTEPIRQLTGLLEDQANGPVVICGPAGVGKTALAVHWAHRMRHLFPGGQLYVDLRGFAPNALPLRPIDVLARALRSLGVAPEAVPADLDEAVGRYRTLLADSRMLILLDNARDPDQVRPLLPGGAGNLVLVTSRNHLAGLVARDGATRLTVDALSDRESLDLLGGIIGAQRVAKDLTAAADVIRLCAHLPLALRIAATNLQDDGGDGMAEYADRLRGNALDELAVDGDQHSAVRAAFDVSYLALPPRSRLLFRRLGLVPGPDVTAETAAIVGGTTTADAATGLRLLTRMHLIQERQDARFGFHDLLGEYAHHRAHADDPPCERANATASLYDHYLSTVDAAARQLYPHLARLPLEAETGAGFGSTAEASAWLDAERANLVAAIQHCAEHGPRRVAWLLADSLRGYFVSRMHVIDWSTCAEAGLAAAVAEADPHGRAAAELSLATLRSRLGDQASAIDGYATCLALARQVGWTAGEVAALGSLGNAHLRQGQPEPAEVYFTEVLEHARRSGQALTQAAVLSNLGLISMESGRLAEAADRYARALDVVIAIGAPTLEANALANLGEAHHALGLLDLAVEQLTDALAKQRHIGDRDGESFTLCHLAAVHRDRDDLDQATELAERALDLAVAAAHRRYDIDARNVLASVAARRGDPATAALHFREALSGARVTGYRFAEAVALIGIGGLERLRGDVDAATGTLTEALAVARGGGFRVPQANALASLAAVHLDRGDLAAALTTAQAALEVAATAGYPLGEARARDVLNRVRDGS